MSRGSPRQRASELLHHLLNQSLSGLDFCILWQQLAADEGEELAEADQWVKEFLDSASLAALDKALALLPQPSGEAPEPLVAQATPLQEGWRVVSHRVREVSRADFTCVSCGFTITLSQEHPSNTEMRLPFENFSCPNCEDFSADQGTLTDQTKAVL